MEPSKRRTEMVRAPVRVRDAQAKADSPCLRVTWVPRHDQVLLSLMIEQVRKGARNATGFTKDAWRYMLSRFNRKLNLQYVVIQLKNRFKYYRGQYNMVKYVLEQGEFKWDSLTRTLRADNEVWEKHIEKHPTFSKYRNRQLPYEEFQKIFGSMNFDDHQLETSAQLVESGDGVMLDGTNGKKSIGADGESMESPTSLDELVGTPNSEQSEGSLPSGENMGLIEQQNKHQSPSNSSSRRGSKRRLGSVEDLHDALLKIAEASKLRASARVESMREKWPVDKCIKELKLIEGLEDDLFVKALFIFRDEYNRSVFLSVDGDRRISWLRAACRGVSL